MPRIVIGNQPIPSGNMAVLESFFSTCVHLLFQYAPSHPNINCEIRIKYSKIGPHTRYDGDATKGYDVDLTSENDFWCNHLYQFSHEACHILAQCQNSQTCNQWFEESLCEAASLFSAKAIADMGTQGPCGHYMAETSIFYYQYLNNYADQLINDPARQFASTKMDQWFSLNETVLRLNPYCRCLQWIVANKLLLMFLKEPSNLAAIEFLNTIPCSNGKDSFLQYLDNWKIASPQLYHALIDEIKELFF